MGLYHAVQAALGVEQRSADSGVVGLVGMGRMAGNATSGGVAGGGAVPLSMRVSTMLMLLGSLNLALFAFNLVPLLPLDGGHVLGACWEGIRRSIAKAQVKPDPGPVDTASMLPAGQVVFGRSSPWPWSWCGWISPRRCEARRAGEGVSKSVPAGAMPHT